MGPLTQASTPFGCLLGRESNCHSVPLEAVAREAAARRLQVRQKAALPGRPGE